MLIDATVVRMVLVPSVMELLGQANWWMPRWLDRVSPIWDRRCVYASAMSDESFQRSETPSPSVAAERPGMKPRSYEVTEGAAKAPARAMLRAVGMTDDDWDKPQVGVASSWNEVTPCNLPLDRLAKRAKEGVRAAGGFPFEFVTIAVSDGISMGHEGMRASLVSREVIADSVETVMHAERFDALVDLRRLRQVAAGHADGRRPAQPARACSSTAGRSCRAGSATGRSTS